MSNIIDHGCLFFACSHYCTIEGARIRTLVILYFKGEHVSLVSFDFKFNVDST